MPKPIRVPIEVYEDCDNDNLPPGWWVVAQDGATFAVCPTQLHALTIARLLTNWFDAVPVTP